MKIKRHITREITLTAEEVWYAIAMRNDFDTGDVKSTELTCLTPTTMLLTVTSETENEDG